MEGKSFKIIKDNWIVIAFIVQAIITWTVLNNTVNNHEMRITELETYRKEETIVLTDIRSRLSSIETSILFIKEAVK